MADKKVSALAAGTAITDADLFYYIDGATSKKVTALILKDYVLDSVDISKSGAGSPAYFIGSGAGAADLDGNAGSIGIGENALNDATDADWCVAVGYCAGSKITTGDRNTIVGALAGEVITDGDSNTCIGTNAGGALTTGDENTLLGDSAGGALTTVNGCVCIGYQAGSANTTANLLFIDNSNTATPLIGGDFANNRVGINLDPSALTASFGVAGDIDCTTGYKIDGSNRIDGSGFFVPVISSDAAAPNNSIYYSTTAVRLVFKDSGGGVNNLY